MFAGRYNHTEHAKACKAEKCKNRPIFAVFCFATAPQPRQKAKARGSALRTRDRYRQSRRSFVADFMSGILS